jgi:hypothetical protein
MNRLESLNLECPVCNTRSTDTTFILLRCSHVICAQCMFNIYDSTYNKTCPLCRQDNDIWVQLYLQNTHQNNAGDNFQNNEDDTYISSSLRIFYIVCCILAIELAICGMLSIILPFKSC